MIRLKENTVDVSEIPPIRIFEVNGQLFTLDNRRHYAFKKAGVPIKTVPATATEIQKESYKFSTANGGVDINVRKQ